VEYIAGWQEIHDVQIVLRRGPADGRLAELAVCIDDARQAECCGDRVAQSSGNIDELLCSSRDLGGILVAVTADHDFRVCVRVRGTRSRSLCEGRGGYRKAETEGQGGSGYSIELQSNDPCSKEW